MVKCAMHWWLVTTAALLELCYTDTSPYVSYVVITLTHSAHFLAGFRPRYPHFWHTRHVENALLEKELLYGT